MEKRNDSDFLPLVLTGVVMLIMGAAVVMYPGEPTEPNGRAQTSAASADSQPATPGRGKLHAAGSIDLSAVHPVAGAIAELHP